MKSLTGKFSGLLVLLLLPLHLLYAQGSLSGVITDKGTKEGLIGATVLLIGTYKGASTDVNGRYTISNIKAGDYSVRVSYVGYKEKIFNGIRIPKEGTITLTTSLEEQTNQLETVEVIGGRVPLPSLLDTAHKQPPTSFESMLAVVRRSGTR